MATLVKITYTNYTENAVIDSVKKEKELLRIKDTDKTFVKYELVTQGNFQLKNDSIIVKTFEMGNDDEWEFNATFEISGNKVKQMDFDDFGDGWRNCWQKVNETGKGQWVRIYGERKYFLNGFEM